MEEPHIEGPATHDDPESCAGVREGNGEALTGARAGTVLSREKAIRGADAVNRGGRPHGPRATLRVLGRPRAVGDPWHVRNLFAREPGDPRVARRGWRGGTRWQGHAP